jgi:alpha-1,6-mannosyltransferase
MRDLILQRPYQLLFDGLTVAACGACAYYLGWQVERSDTVGLLSVAAIWVGAYLWLMVRGRGIWAEPTWQIGLGLVLRLVVLGCTPLLSDDIYRFVWDGHLIVTGIHPMAYTPRELLASGTALPDVLTSGLFDALNSPDYHTVYPPVHQFFFGCSAWLGGTVEGCIFTLKCLLFAGELIALFALSRWGAPRLAAWWALCPLAIIEIVGNAHFEGLMVAFWLISLRFLTLQRPVPAAFWWALAIATKLLPLLFVPIAMAWLGWRRGLVFLGTMLAVTVLLFVPLLDREVLAHMGQSVGLYFQHFEFNASVYYVARFTANRTLWMETAYVVSKILAVLTVVGILAEGIRLLRSDPRTPEGLYVSVWSGLMLYLVNATTVHPWYVLVPLGIGLMTRWRVVAIGWSGLVWLSYSHYAGDGTLDNYVLVMLEYVLLILLAIGVYMRSREAA